MGLTYNVSDAGIVTLTNDLIVDTNVLKVDATGNFVGINKTTPVKALDVVGDIDATGTVTGNALVVIANGQLGSVSLGTASPAASALLEMVSTTKGFLAPRMTEAQRDAIGSPATGLLIYNTDTNAYNFYDGASWAAVGTGSGGSATYTRTTATGTGAQTIFTTPTYTLGNSSLLVYNGGVLMTKTTDYAETSTTSITFNVAPDSGAVLSFIVASAGADFGYTKSVQTAAGSAAFTVPEYTVGDDSLLVFKDGVLMEKGGSADYVETNSTTVTFNTTPTIGAKLSFIIASSVAVTPAAAGATSDVQFNTAGVLDADTGVFVWDSANNRLGIGIASPTYNLQVAPAANADGILIGGSANSPALTLSSTAAPTITPVVGCAAGASQFLTGSIVGDLCIRNSGGAGASILLGASGTTPAMIVQNSTNIVGIGTLSPDANAKLDVVGAVRAQQLTDVQQSTSGGTPAVDWSVGAVATLTLSAATTISTANFSNARQGQTLTIIITQDAATPRTVAWTGVVWPGGTAPTMSTGLSKKDFVTIYYDGTTYYGFNGGQDY